MKFKEKIKLIYRAYKYKYKSDKGGIKYILESLKPFQTALDIGAHKGGYLYFMQKCVTRKGKIYAFEPQADLAVYLNKIIANFKWKNVIIEHVKPIIAKLTEAGIKVVEGQSSVRVVAYDRAQAVDIKTLPYPGFPTDLQAPIMALMCTSKGNSIITETVFENRFMHVCELQRMGAHIEVKGSMALVQGRENLIGAPVMATDLRASVCLVIAGLVARGKTEIHRVYHLDRGYEKLEEKLLKLGANIMRVPEHVTTLKMEGMASPQEIVH